MQSVNVLPVVLQGSVLKGGKKRHLFMACDNLSRQNLKGFGLLIN